jgi:cytochrome P450
MNRETRLNSLSTNPNKFSLRFREQLARMEIIINPFKVLFKATPFFTLFVDYKRREMYGLLRPLILQNIQTVSTSKPHTIIQAAVNEYSQEEASRGWSRIHDESFVKAVFHQLMIFFFAGDDAAAMTTPWAVFHLQRNPEILATLRAEHDAVLRTNPDDAADRIRANPHILNALPYTLAVIKETLRLSPATTTMRKGQHDFAFHITEPGTNWPENWPTGGFELIDSPKTIHTDPKLFPRPHEFIPERYLVSDSHPLHPTPNTWRAFQLGVRKCIGSELAMMQIKLVLLLMVRKFDIELAWEEWDIMREKQGIKVQRQTVEGERLYTTGKATAHPKDGAPVHLRLRQIQGQT